VVGDGDGAERVAVGGDERGGGVEAGARRAPDERAVGVGGFGQGVADDEYVGLCEGVFAEGVGAGNLPALEAVGRFEPETVAVDERDPRGGSPARGCS
jgi:hypothetical protein